MPGFFNVCEEMAPTFTQIIYFCKKAGFSCVNGKQMFIFNRSKRIMKPLSKFPLFILGLIYILSSCRPEKQDDTSTVNIRLKKDPERINPLVFPNPVAREVYQYLHLPLADFDPESLQLTPLLMDALPAEMPIDTGKYKGGIYFDITISNKAKWDDGSPVTAADYAFTMKAINLPLTNAGKYREISQNISDIITYPDDPKKLRVIFLKDYINALETAVNTEIYPKYFYDSLGLLDKYPFSRFTAENEDILRQDSSVVRFARAFNGSEFSSSRISGCGPYRFVSWQPNQSIVLERKQDYWASGSKVPALRQGPDKMVFHIIPDEVTAVAQLKAGNIDIINEISAESYTAMSEDPALKEKFNFFHPSLIKQYYINLNLRDKILRDKNVRMALANLTDVDNILKNIENGMGVRATGPIHPLKKTYNAAVSPVSFDTEKAKTLLAEAGWKDSDKDGILDKVIDGKRQALELEILISGQELGKKLSLLLQENALKAGIKINIKEKDFKLIRAENLKPRNFQLVPSVMSQDIIPWDDMSRWHSENNTPDGSNDMSYSNREVDSMIDRILTTKSDTARIALYQRIQEQIAQDQPVIFLYCPEEKIVVSRKWAATATAKRPGYMANTFTLADKAVTTQQ